MSLIINASIPLNVLSAADAQLALPSIKIVSKIEGATVYINGKVIGLTPLGDAIQIENEFYSIRVEKDGYTAWQQKGIIVSPGEVLTLNPVMVPVNDGQLPETTVEESIAPSKITLSTAIRDAEVYLNGKIMGKTPLLETTEFKPGIYIVEVRKEGYLSWKKEVMVTEGETLVLTPLMVPLSKAEEESESKHPIVAKKPYYERWWYWTLVVAAAGYAWSKSGSDSNEGAVAGTW